MQNLVRDLNRLFTGEKAIYEQQYHPQGFEWIDFSDEVQSVIVFLRKGKKEEDQIMVICNFTPETREKYEIGVSHKGEYKVILNTDDKKYGGSGFTDVKSFKSTKKPSHGRDRSIVIDLPPLAIIALKVD
jgi:1,4-alpha-glucan branching enzyme